MSELSKARRIVTGLDAEGRSCVTIDGPLVPLGQTSALAWRTEGLPADNSHTGDCPPAEFSFDLMHAGGSMFMLNEYSPGIGEFWHATDTLEYIVMLQGEVTFATETGEVTLRQGDLLVDRGVVHSWRNESGEKALAAIVILPAHPAGKGRTV